MFKNTLASIRFFKTNRSILGLFLFWSLYASANMASPFNHGTKTSTAFSSKDIDILSETIFIKINKDFNKASYIIEYTIHTDKNGKQIPLLFYAQDYESSFNVWVDSTKVGIQNVPKGFIKFNNSSFTEALNSDVMINWDENNSQDCNINDLKYFETNIDTGLHKIRVEYNGLVWEDRNDWVKQYSFHYSLTPANFWRSFGKLIVVVQQDSVIRNITTNLWESLEKKISAKNSWEFNKLPHEYIKISYVPEIKKIAKTLINIGPSNIMIIVGILLFLMHIFILIWHRKRNPSNKYSPVVIGGSILIPFLILYSYMYSFYFIDDLIGEGAGSHHGYVFFILLLYPVLLFCYWIFIWGIDSYLKKRYNTNPLN